MKTKSKIFTDAEYAALQARMNGDKKDKMGIYASRVKPKLHEMLDVWMLKRDELKGLVDTLDRLDEDEVE